MTLFHQRVNIQIIFSVYSIYVTYLLRPVDLTDIWLLVKEIQGPWNLWIVQFGIKKVKSWYKKRQFSQYKLPLQAVHHAYSQSRDSWPFKNIGYVLYLWLVPVNPSILRTMIPMYKVNTNYTSRVETKQDKESRKDQEMDLILKQINLNCVFLKSSNIWYFR